MITMTAEAFRDLSEVQMWELPEDEYLITHLQGRPVRTIKAELELTWYQWRLYSLYPTVEILASHHACPDGARFTSRQHLSVLGDVLFHVHGWLNHLVPIEVISKQTYQIVNQTFNSLSVKYEKFVTSVDMSDFYNIALLPAVKAANDAVEPTMESIEATYKVIENEILNGSMGLDNAIIAACRTELVSMPQVLQALGPRGFLTDIDSTIFSNPILTGYVEGMNSTHDFAIESRSGAKALVFTGDPLADVEWFNRRMQIVCCYVEKLVIGDCGTTDTIEWSVTEDNVDDLVGKHYYTQEEPTVLRTVTRSDKPAIDTVINMRTVRMCALHNPAHVCLTCFGEQGISIPEGSNLGHLCSTTFCAPVSQKVISTKHYTGTSTFDAITLSPLLDGILSCKYGDVNVFRHPDLKGELIIGIAPKYISLPTNITELQPKHIVPSRLSNLQQMTIESHPDLDTSKSGINMASNKRIPSLSLEVLRMLYDGSLTIIDYPNGRRCIDLTDVSIDTPLFTYPLREVPMLEFMNSISTLLESKSPTEAGNIKDAVPVKSLIHMKSYKEGLELMYSKCKEKLNVNIVLLEVMVYAFMTRDHSTGDYRLPTVSSPDKFCRYMDCVKNRSIASGLANSHQYALLTNPASFLNGTRRPSHLMDALLIHNSK